MLTSCRRTSRQPSAWPRATASYDEEFACICDLQNDTMLVSGFYRERREVEVHWPMSPQRGVVAIPMTPYDHFGGPSCTVAQLLLKVQHQGGRNRLVYVLLSLGFLRKENKYSFKYKAHIYVLQQDGQWRFRSLAEVVLPYPKPGSKPLLVGTKIYLEHSTSIAALDLETSSFSTIPLPEGMERYDCKDMMLSATYDSGFFLIHLDKDLELCIWLHIGDWWQLLDVVSLPGMFATLGVTGWTADGEPATLFQTTKTGDFAEFVFLKLGKCALCYDTRRRVLRKVYEVTQEDQTLEQIHPFMMTWPPIFPALKGDHLARSFSADDDDALLRHSPSWRRRRKTPPPLVPQALPGGRPVAEFPLELQSWCGGGDPGRSSSAPLLPQVGGEEDQQTSAEMADPTGMVCSVSHFPAAFFSQSFPAALVCLQHIAGMVTEVCLLYHAISGFEIL
nr:uncharacterized protein LOC127309974 [Lolium perenne]